MINIVVWDKDYVDIDTEKYEVKSKSDLIFLLCKLLNKVYYSNDPTVLEFATTEKSGAKFTEVDRWKRED